MQTSRRQISLFTEDELTSSAGASPANPTQAQASDLGKKMTATSGQRCCDAFGRFPRVGLWGKTFSALLIGQEGWSSTRCRLIWKLKASKFNRMFFQLQASTLPTEETGSGLLLTEMLPTPTASECRDTQLTAEQAKKLDKGGRVLRRLGTLGMLPTPTKVTHKTSGISRKAWNKRIKDGRQECLNMAIHKTTGTTSQLNPQFVEEMMGFPENWTASPFQSGATNPSKPTGTQ